MTANNSRMSKSYDVRTILTTSVVGGVWGCVSETVKVSEWGWIATAGGCAFVPSLWK